jgi:ribonuclease VapC
MVVDTSAIIAIIFEESDADYLLSKLAVALSRQASVVSYVEATMVLISRRGESAAAQLDPMLARADIEVVPVSMDQARLASAAFKNFGKGRHPAGLNFGDCFSYALAKNCGEPLLFKGVDFAKTDVQKA